MIPLTKFEPGHPVHGAGIRWLAEQMAHYLAARLAGANIKPYATKYRDRRIKDVILAETNEKCAYCEAKCMDVDFGNVEHIRPKSKFPERMLDYQNLTLACRQCNTWKGNEDYDDGDGLLDPYVDDPSPYMFAAGTLLIPEVAHSRCIRATRTIEAAKLNRIGLIESRKDHLLTACHSLASDYENAPNANIRKYARKKIDALCAPDAEFSLIARAFFKRYISDL